MRKRIRQQITLTISDTTREHLKRLAALDDLPIGRVIDRLAREAAERELGGKS